MHNDTTGHAGSSYIVSVDLHAIAGVDANLRPTKRRAIIIGNIIAYDCATHRDFIEDSTRIVLDDSIALDQDIGTGDIAPQARTVIVVHVVISHCQKITVD